MRRAVFLDRDGVINKLILNPLTREFEAPHTPEDLFLCDDTIPSLHQLQNAGFELFLISNQPDFAKGKTTLENIQEIHKKFEQILIGQGIRFRAFYYCYHHPHGFTQEYSFECECRKPKPYFLLKASQDYGIDLADSWMIGDRDSDIECGQRAGTRTIQIQNPDSKKYQGLSSPDFFAGNLRDAVQILLHA